ncbi:hypothetical protein LJC25_04275, partial [Bacteroidales bacterium OttesenSCG-928-K03]|nr:hypothetical protein [Bacteroidales bacterium OttesenSCG-928-K03]
LSSISAFNKLTHVEGVIIFSALNSLISIDAFHLLQNVNGRYLTIDGCRHLKDISSLSNIATELEDITITNCSNLYDFCPIVPLVENMTGTWYVTGCGYNPTKYQMLNGDCSQ